jgi:hypothetical protein
VKLTRNVELLKAAGPPTQLASLLHVVFVLPLQKWSVRT